MDVGWMACSACDVLVHRNKSGLCATCADSVTKRPVVQVESLGGLKYDADKLDLTLPPVRAHCLKAKVLQFGATKYTRDNWRKGIDELRLLAGALRHIYKDLLGEKLDPESGLPHLAHAGTAIDMVLEYRFAHLSIDELFTFNTKQEG